MCDEQEIRDLFNNWIKSTTEGNLELARQCIADNAYLWIESTLVCSPKNGDPSSKMAGHSLSILEKREGRWQIIRDANTMTSVPE